LGGDPVELSDLVGTRQLSDVETGQISVANAWGDNEECRFVKFTLDGVHYMAVEDPGDGYWSRCRELVVLDEAPRYSFPPQEMRCFMKAKNEYGERADVLVMQDTTTGEIVLEVGTENYDDYYPYCHFEYHPEGMACNDPNISDDDFSRIIMS